jgi:hypothetical protein
MLRLHENFELRERSFLERRILANGQTLGLSILATAGQHTGASLTDLTFPKRIRGAVRAAVAYHPRKYTRQNVLLLLTRR